MTPENIKENVENAAPYLMLSLTKKEYKKIFSADGCEPNNLLPGQDFIEDDSEMQFFAGNDYLTELGKLGTKYRVAIPTFKANEWLKSYPKKKIKTMPAYFQTNPYAFASLSLIGITPAFLRERNYLTEDNLASMEKKILEALTAQQEALNRINGKLPDTYSVAWEQYLLSTVPFSVETARNMALPEIWIGNPISIRDAKLDVRRNGHWTQIGELIEKYL